MMQQMYAVFGRLSVLVVVAMMLGASRGQTLDMVVSSQTVDINTPFEVVFTVSDMQGEATIEVEGIDAFDVLGQSRSQSTQLINGQASSQIALTLQLQAKSTGSFALGPATIETNQGTISSTAVSIEVGGEELFGSNPAILDTPGLETDDAGSSPSFNWIGWVFAVLLVALLVRTVRMVRRSRTISHESSLEMHSTYTDTSPTLSGGWKSDDPLIDTLIDYAQKTVDNPYANLADLASTVNDGELQGLLRRVERQTYSGQEDVTLHEDISTYLESDVD